MAGRTSLAPDFLRQLRRIKYERICSVAALCRAVGIKRETFDKACHYGILSEAHQARLEPFVAKIMAGTARFRYRKGFEDDTLMRLTGCRCEHGAASTGVAIHSSSIRGRKPRAARNAAGLSNGFPAT
jgi:hypothetical protein